jgi:hypothetical protein
MTDLAKLVGEDAEHLWNSLPYVKTYNKDGEVYGVIGAGINDNLTMLYFHTVGNGSFTYSMIRDIVKKYNTVDMCVIVPEAMDFYNAERFLSIHGFICYHIEDEAGKKMMYAIHYKEDSK